MRSDAEAQEWCRSKSAGGCRIVLLGQELLGGSWEITATKCSFERFHFRPGQADSLGRLPQFGWLDHDGVIATDGPAGFVMSKTCQRKDEPGWVHGTTNRASPCHVSSDAKGSPFKTRRIRTLVLGGGTGRTANQVAAGVDIAVVASIGEA